MVRIAARPEPIEINLARTALIVVDMQNSYGSKGGMLDVAGRDISGVPPIIEVHHRLLDTARKAGIRIIYLQMTYKPDLSDAGGPDSPNYHKQVGVAMMRKRPELDGKFLVKGTWDWKIIKGLEPQPGDWVVEKPRYSGFCGTALDSLLRSEDIRYVILTGVATNVCVESTAREAFFKEFWPIVVEDAVSHTGPDCCREASIWNIQRYFGWITNSDTLMEIFDAEAKRAAMEEPAEEGAAAG